MFTSQRYNGQSPNTRSNQIILEILLRSCIPLSNIPSWDWCLIDSTINLILWDKPPASCRRWVTKVEQPSITGYGQLHLHSLRSRRKAQSVLSRLHVAAEEQGGPRPRTISVSSWPRLAWPGAGGTLVRQTGSGTLRRLSLLQNAPTAYVVGHDCHNVA